MIEITNGTGHHKTAEKEANKKRMRSWYSSNKGATQMQCSKAMGLSYPTVLRLTKEILSEDEAKKKADKA